MFAIVCEIIRHVALSADVRLRFCHQICRQRISAPNSASFCLKFGLLTTSLCLWGKLILSICVVWGELQVPAGCGGSPAYAPRNRFPVVGMRYGPLPLFNHSTPIDPPSRQSLRALSYPTQNTTRYVQLYSAGCNKRTHGRSGELFDDNGENVNIDLVAKDHFDSWTHSNKSNWMAVNFDEQSRIRTEERPKTPHFISG